MSSEINLLSNRNEGLLKREKQIKGFRFAAGISLFLVILCSLVSFLLSRSLSYDLAKKNQDSILQEISLLRNKQTKLIFVRDRLEGIAGIIQQRVHYSRTINLVLGKIPEEVSVESMLVSKKNLNITISSTSLTSIDAVTRNLTDLVSRKEVIKKLVLESLTLSPKDGRYLVSLAGDL